ncbi:MAG: extracellular matrix/biofilm biosynthesis regulator RemA family protein [Candidatus Muiribacteriota bacterium]
MEESRLINIGFGNYLNKERMVSIISPDSAPVKRLKDEARKSNKLVDATCGRKTRAIVVTDSDHIVLIPVQPETLAGRFEGKNDEK